MYKLLTALLFVALFVGASAFKTATTNTQDAVAKSEIVAAPETMTSLNVVQPLLGVPLIFASWTSTINGPFYFCVGDLTTNTLVVSGFTNVNEFNRIFAGLTIGHTYIVSVDDSSVMSKQITLK
jgi:hypothetical protein